MGGKTIGVNKFSDSSENENVLHPPSHCTISTSSYQSDDKTSDVWYIFTKEILFVGSTKINRCNLLRNVEKNHLDVKYYLVNRVIC